MHTPAKGASLVIGFEGSNPSLHAKEKIRRKNIMLFYETPLIAFILFENIIRMSGESSESILDKFLFR